MVVLPLLRRELRVQARKRKLGWLRAIAAGVTFASFIIPVLLGTIDLANGRAAFLALSIFPFRGHHRRVHHRRHYQF